MWTVWEDQSGDVYEVLSPCPGGVLVRALPPLTPLRLTSRLPERWPTARVNSSRGTDQKWVWPRATVMLKSKSILAQAPSPCRPPSLRLQKPTRLPKTNRGSGGRWQARFGDLRRLCACLGPAAQGDLPPGCGCAGPGFKGSAPRVWCMVKMRSRLTVVAVLPP